MWFKGMIQVLWLPRLHPGPSEGHITQCCDFPILTDGISEQPTPAIALVFSSFPGSTAIFTIQDRSHEIIMVIMVIFYLTDYLLVQRISLFSNRITSRVQCWPLVAVETLIPTVLKMILCRIFLWLCEALCLSFLIVRLKSFLKFKCQLIESYFR